VVGVLRSACGGHGAARAPHASAHAHTHTHTHTHAHTHACTHARTPTLPTFGRPTMPACTALRMVLVLQHHAVLLHGEPAQLKPPALPPDRHCTQPCTTPGGWTVAAPVFMRCYLNLPGATSHMQDCSEPQT
jgi:hypothetical protein